ncbi:hypothetical protein LTR09_010226 [Extremus antarcticus]|uniref:Domain of unknown function at the cortex 1 domain-containing protein n=1 Tax=Extremus antarcticus TaxID=702011 RepID=A0AAJ0D7Z1_9PEZI|nr:hypothetical protein LTR09_010226 [Extremus antarcticus]
MSSLKAKLASALPTTRSPSASPRNSLDAADPSNAAAASMAKKKDDPEKYRLLVTAGPSYSPSTHKIVHVNTSTPTTISNDFMTASIKVRIRGYKGLPATSPASSKYFEDPMHEKDQYSIAFSFVPKVDLPSKDVVWGNDFDHPVRDRLPPGVNTAFKIVKDWVDPGLEMDAYADEPWLYGPALSCWFAFRIGDKQDSAPREPAPSTDEASDVLHEGSTPSASSLRANIPDAPEKRRKHFLSAQNRAAFTFEQGREYSGDFFNPYLDFGNFALKLPGFSIKVIKYIDEKSHTLRGVIGRFAGGEAVERESREGVVEEHGDEKGRSEQVANGQPVTEDSVGGTTPPEPSVQRSPQPVDGAAEEEESGAHANEEIGKAADGVPQPAPQPSDGAIGDHSAHSNGEVEKPAYEAPPPLPQQAGGSTYLDYRPAKSGVEASPGMRDKPDHVREEMEQLSIAQRLLQTSSKDGRGGGRVLDELD